MYCKNCGKMNFEIHKSEWYNDPKNIIFNYGDWFCSDKCKKDYEWLKIITRNFRSY
jgi:hypothetical protein